MKINPFLLSSAVAFTLSCAITAATLYFKSRSKEINDVMVFCKLQFNAWNCFDKLVSYIEAAETCINVCMPSIQNPAIQARLVKVLKEKNIKLRIIIDRSGYTDSTDFFLQELLESGAEIKCRSDEVYNMHHKFCVIDDKILMTGTLNWGSDRSSDDWNYVYVTNKPQLVEPVKTEFYRMWSIDTDLEEAINVESVSYDSDDTENEAPEGESNVQNKANFSIQSQCEMPITASQPGTPDVCIN